MLLTKEVTVEWNPNNIKHYTNLDYTFTRKHDTFNIPIEHLSPKDAIIVE